MRLLTTVLACLGLAFAALCAGIPPTPLPTDVVVTPTNVATPTDSINPNMGAPMPIVGPPAGTCGEVVPAGFGNPWLSSYSGCHRISEKGDIAAREATFVNEHYKNCKSCTFWM